MPRSLILALVALAVLALATAAPATSAPLAQGNSASAFGVNSHLASRYPEISSMGGPADLVVQAGAGVAREDFQLFRIAERPGVYNWAFHDRMVDLLVARGVTVIGLLNGPTPGWAAGGNPANDFYPPDPAVFAEFAAAAAARYKGRITYWQVWNEPDNATYWKPRPDPAAYTALLRAAYPAIKGANPEAQVLSAGLVTPEPAVSFLQAIHASGGWGAFDILAVHPYVDPFSPEEGQIDAAGIGSVRALADRLGSKPIWATEYGWSTDPGDRDGRVVDEATQAAYLVRGAALMRAAGAERVVWYNLKDISAGQGLGLLRLGGGRSDYGRPKPSFNAWRTLNQQLAGAGPTGRVDFGGSQVAFDFESFGNWRRGDQANGTFTQSAAQRRSGSFAGQLTYQWPSGGNDFVIFSPRPAIALPGAPAQLGVWVYGDGSGHALKVWLRDAEGEVLQFRLGFVGAAGWNLLAASITGQVESYNRVSGSGNLRLDFPAQLQAIVLDDEPDSSVGGGTIYLDDLTVTSGPQAYGVRFARGGGVIDVLWAAQPGQVSLPTGSAQGTITDLSGTSRSIGATNGQFVLDLGPAPIFLSHGGGGGGGGGSTPPSAPPPAPPGGPLTGERCFPETGFCISGRIREYWEQSGGLPVFGYPVTAQREELIEGRPYQVQWFERNRLELHPENQRPYDVLLGRLGADRLAQQGRDWQQFARTGQQPGCRFFSETGQSVCGRILEAWRANGLEIDGQPGYSEGENLALFGLPLSPPQVETLSDGRQYTVQWFERARFELHPENARPYDVLLGLLGNEISGR